MLQAGFGKADLTPPLGTHLAGHFSERPAQGIHDPLLATAVVMESGDERLAIVSCDLLGVPREVVRSVRDLVHQQVGLEAHQVMVHGTHTHAGPEMRSERHGVDGRYVDLAIQKIATAVVLAVRNLAPCELVFTRGSESRLSFNRRFWMKDGSVRMNPGIGNTDIVRPAGPIDPDVLGLWVMREGQPAGLVANFACHLDVLGAQYLVSADVPHYLRQTLSDALARSIPVVYLSGTCGDINHINVTGGPGQSGFDHSAKMGRTLAGELLRSLQEAVPIEDTPLIGLSTQVQTSWRGWPEAEVEAARRTVDDPSVEKATWTRHRAMRILTVDAHHGEPRELEVQVFRIGSAAVVGVPGEVFCGVGLDIKKASPLPHVMVAELCNDNPGYIPLPSAFDEGGYEVDSAACAPETAALLVEAASNLLAKAVGG
ncbi:MAG: neutral/alkaline non-lysosomal ceramidase N-terminal domain-containing protein [Armatimonadota bacterium]